jgi:hypothetical protein
VCQEPGQFVVLGRELDHVLNDQVVAGFGECREAAVESGEEAEGRRQKGPIVRRGARR